VPFRAVVGGTAGTAMALPLFGPIMIFKNYTFRVFISIILLFSQFLFFLLLNRNKKETLLYLEFDNRTDNLDLKQVATEFCASRERRQRVLGALKNLNIINSSTNLDLLKFFD